MNAAYRLRKAEYLREKTRAKRTRRRVLGRGLDSLKVDSAPKYMLCACGRIAVFKGRAGASYCTVCNP